MKIMFISDIHGDLDSLKIVKDIYNKEHVDKVIILGDVFYGNFYNFEDIDNTLTTFKDPIVTKGNCDSEVDVLTSKVPFFDYIYDEFFNKRFFCSHGHKYNITRYPDKEFDVMVNGHTHIGMIKMFDNKIFLNPGSISRPREESQKSFMIIDDNGIFLKDLDNNIIDKFLWESYNIINNGGNYEEKFW